MTTLIHPGERLDELHPYGLFILQHPDAFRFGTDAVLLAHFARAKKQHRVLDLGHRHRHSAVADDRFVSSKAHYRHRNTAQHGGYGAAQRCLQRSGLLYRYCNW